MAKIEGIKTLIAQLGKLKAKFDNDGKCVVVGYTQAYALFVHEMVPGQPRPPMSDEQRRAMFAAIAEREARGHVPWAVGQPKFLEQPARELSNDGELARIVVTVIKKGGTPLQGLLMAGLRLQRESQILCPVDTSALKASAFTRIEDLP